MPAGTQRSFGAQLRVLREAAGFTQTLSMGLSAVLIFSYALGMLFSLKTHHEFFGSAGHNN